MFFPKLGTKRDIDDIFLKIASDFRLVLPYQSRLGFGVKFQSWKRGKVGGLGVCGLALVLKRLSFLAQAKVYLFWRKGWEGEN